MISLDTLSNKTLWLLQFSSCGDALRAMSQLAPGPRVEVMDLILRKASADLVLVAEADYKVDIEISGIKESLSLPNPHEKLLLLYFNQANNDLEDILVSAEFSNCAQMFRNLDFLLKFGLKPVDFHVTRSGEFSGHAIFTATTEIVTEELTKFCSCQAGLTLVKSLGPQLRQHFNFSNPKN